MDPCSVISLLGALCNLIEASHHLLQIAKILKDGERDLLELYNDVSFFEEALKGFDRVLRSRETNHSISASVINKALEESSTTIQELESRLCQIVKSETSAVRRMKWLQNRSTVRKLHGRVKTQGSMLQSFLALAHTETFLNACRHYPQLLQVSSLPEAESPGDMLTWVEFNPSETSSLESIASPASFSRTSVDTAPTSIGSSGSSLQKITSNTSDGSSRSSRSECSTGPLIVRKACRVDCYCSCHPSTEVKRSSISSLSKSFSHSGLSKTQCDDPNCQSGQFVEQAAGSMSHFFQKALSHVMAAHTVKVRYHIGTFHMVPEGSDVMRYAKKGSLDNLKAAIQSGRATLWDTAPDGWSLLHTAAYNRQLPTVKYLLELGADTEVADIGSRKPADLAILNSLLNGATQVEHEINKAFAQKDDYLSDFDFTPIHVAVLDLYDSDDHERPSLEQLLELVDDCNNAPAGKNWAKWKSKYKKRSPLFGTIIEYFRASAYEQPKTFKVIHNLIDRKDKCLCWTPLLWACSTGKRDKIKTLMYHGADPFILSNLGANILHAAAESKSLGGLDDALDIWRRYPDQLNINQLNHWGESALHVAAWGSVENVRKLVEAGADRSVRQQDGQVPLHCTGMTARGKVRRQIIDLLCMGDNGDHINAQDIDGRPPLFDFLDDASCVEMLISYGASLDLLDTTGKSAFHHACMQDNHGTLKTLLRLSRAGSVLVTVKDHDGNTALNLALSHRSRCCALVLLELDEVGDMVGQDGWAAIHHAAKLGDCKVLEAVLHYRSYNRGMKTIDGKTAEVVAMEAGTWCGEVKDLLRRYNSIT